ncbi:MAG: hypothetical protein EZS28_023291 [Streblomastix strix]|uniref:Uncharacterized protein n=1 Tax=Streblomastix strix TaxID=222440 RepID=A0A5J4VFF2_9EUKA|nr:MAG: hypothetical protein EZS28_023291 [Streblomastix strix]
MFFASHPHMSALLDWMEPDEPRILVANINTSALDARDEEDRRFYDERRNGLKINQQRYTRLAVGSEDTIGLSMNASSVGYSLRSSYPSQTQMPGFLSRFH